MAMENGMKTRQIHTRDYYSLCNREDAQRQHFNFKMPLHYPRYTVEDYESMPEWKLDALLSEYGLPVIGDVHQKRKFAMGAFLWPH